MLIYVNTIKCCVCETLNLVQLPMHRLSSVAYPHSNTRAEIGVKSAKRMIMENTGPQGDVDIPAFQRAMLTYRNTPTPLDNRSPAEIVFGRQICYLIRTRHAREIRTM